MKKFIKNNIKLFIGIIIGILLCGGTIYAANSFNANEIPYTENNQTSVKSALDDLYTRANTWIDPSYVDLLTLQTNTTNKILASKKGLCIKRDNKVNCFKVNNWDVEQTHIQQVFSDVSCVVHSSGVGCVASDFYCSVYPNGHVNCGDRFDSSNCEVDSSGSVSCS